jgi:hypothetical protein
MLLNATAWMDITMIKFKKHAFDAIKYALNAMEICTTALYAMKEWE